METLPITKDCCYQWQIHPSRRSECPSPSAGIIQNNQEKYIKLQQSSTQLTKMLTTLENPSFIVNFHVVSAIIFMNWWFLLQAFCLLQPYKVLHLFSSFSNFKRGNQKKVQETNQDGIKLSLLATLQEFDWGRWSTI